MLECATTLAIYSTVNRATKLVSMPNQTRPEMEWNDGIVSSIVTVAEKTIKKVVTIWIRKAA